MSDGKVIFKYVGDTSGIDRSNTEAEGKLHKFGALAGNALLAIGTAAVAAGAAIVKIGSSFESAFAGVIKTEMHQAEIALLRKGIRDMSKELLHLPRNSERWEGRGSWALNAQYP